MLKPTRAKRAHKSKRERRRKAGPRIYGEFVERERGALSVVGDKQKSVTIRVDAAFAEWLRATAKATGRSLTAITRSLLPATPAPDNVQEGGQ